MTVSNCVYFTGAAISSPPRKRLRSAASVSVVNILNCEHCGKPYKTKAGLDHHMAQKHNSLPPPQASASLPVAIETVETAAYDCLQCGKTYKFKKGYDKHMSNKH